MSLFKQRLGDEIILTDFPRRVLDMSAPLEIRLNSCRRDLNRWSSIWRNAVLIAPKALIITKITLNGLALENSWKGKIDIWIYACKEAQQ